MKRLYIVLMLCVVTIAVKAQKFVAEAPTEVTVGEQFRLTYTINSQNVSNFRIGSIPAALEVLMGPSTSQQQSFQMINGHTSSSSSITYTYILCANKEGQYNIPAANISVGGKNMTSNSLRIRVYAASQSSNRQSQYGAGHGQMREAGSRISGSDLFIKVTASKQRVHEQEPILLTYKVCTLVNLTQIDGKMPDLNGVYTQEIDLPQQKSFKVETINGRPYKTVTIRQYVMFPQKTGKIEIPALTFNGMVVQQNRNVDPFEAFFNGGSGYVEVKHSIKAPALTIQVDPLPTRPADFSGGVGQFNITSQPDKQEVRANEPITLRVIVSGTGNLKLIKAPVVEFPKDFDKYDAKITDKTRLTAAGVEGSMVYDCLAIPRHAGKYEIPAVEFVYYDTKTNSYKTLKTQPFIVNVAKGTGNGTGSGSYVSQEELKQLNTDIRYIKTGETKVKTVGEFFFGSLSYWISLVVLMLIFISMFVIFRHRAIDNANIVKQRGKKANKVATKRLKRAKKMMDNGNQTDFYDEVLRTLWGYVGDKLNMPVTQISRENISQCLAEYSVSEEIINQFMQAIDECEFERYAPGDIKGNMSKTFEAAMTAIMDIEDVMKKKKRLLPLMAVILFAMTVSVPLSSFAVTKENADSAYAKQNYVQAIKDYEELLGKGVSADLYYNLGNAYYRTDNITRAVLNYERALLLSPGDKDIRFNLQMARGKTIDKITPETEMFFIIWYRSVVNMMSVDGWARTALISLGLAIVLSLMYLFANILLLRKLGFFCGLAFIVVFIVSNIFAYQQKKVFNNRTGAIIISSSASIKSTPAKSGTDLFILHEGTKVEITDGSMHDWKEIRIADGKEGWIESSQIEII